jgi:hypothetical protein
MQYLAGHASTVKHMLGSIPEQSPSGSIPAQGLLAVTAPAAVYNMPTSSSMSPAQSSLTTAAACAAGERRTSVSAYLQGQQDLLTTITDGVPYVSGMVSLGGAGRCSTASCCSASSILLAQTAGGPAVAGMRMSVDPSATAAAAAGAAAANSRHSAVKEALSARMSTAGRASATDRVGGCIIAASFRVLRKSTCMRVLIWSCDSTTCFSQPQVVGTSGYPEPALNSHWHCC